MPDPAIGPSEDDRARATRAATATGAAPVADWAVASRPRTTLTEEEKADLARADAFREKSSFARGYGDMFRKRTPEEQAARKALPAGELLRQRHLRRAGQRAQAGSKGLKASEALVDATQTTAAKTAGTVSSVFTGGNAVNAAGNAGVLGALASEAVIASDPHIKAEYAASLTDNAQSADELKGSVEGMKAEAPGSSERSTAARTAFQAAGMRAADQANLAALEKLTMRKGLEDVPMEYTVGEKAPEKLGYGKGDVVSRDDTVHGSTLGTLGRRFKHGGAQRGKLDADEKDSVAGLERELHDEKAARTGEYQARLDALTPTQRALHAMPGKRAVLSDAEKQQVADLTRQKTDHADQTKRAKKQLSSQVENLKKAHAKAKKDGRTDAADGFATQLEMAKQQLHETTTAADQHQAELAGQISDIHSVASGGFTRAEKAERSAKKAQIRQIRESATAAQAFTTKHHGETVNAYGRVDGAIDRMDDPEAMKSTRGGTLALAVNRFARKTNKVGKAVGGDAGDMDALRRQGEHAIAGAGAGFGLGMEIAKLAGASTGVGGHIGDGAQKLVSGTLQGAGTLGTALTQSAADEEKKRRFATSVADGSRREQTKTKSIVSLYDADDTSTSVVDGLASATKGVLGMDAVADEITGLAPTIHVDGAVPARTPEVGDGDVGSSGSEVPEGVPPAPEGVATAPEVHEPKVEEPTPEVHEPKVSAAPEVHEPTPEGGATAPEVKEPSQQDGATAPAEPQVASATTEVKESTSESVATSVSGDSETGAVVAEPKGEEPTQQGGATAGGEPRTLTDAAEDTLKGAGLSADKAEEVVDNAQGAAYEATADGVVDTAAKGAHHLLDDPQAEGGTTAHAPTPGPTPTPTPTPPAVIPVAPVIQHDLDADRPAPGVAREPAPQPGPAPRTSWWQRLRQFAGRAASAVGRGMASAGRRMRGLFTRRGRG